MKKFLSILLAAMLVLGMVGTAFAGETTNITIKAKDATPAHTYEIYQIFTGDFNDNGAINVPLWGVNGNGTVGDEVPTDVLNALQSINTTTATDKEKLAVIKEHVKLDSPIETVMSGNEVTVAAGYYLIRDKVGSLANQDDAYTTYIVQLRTPGTTYEIAPKSASPEVDKQVIDEVADCENRATNDTGWGETADHEIGEVFQFRLVATIPNDEDLLDYATYKVVFNDTMSDGVTFDGNVTVKVDDTEVTAEGYTSTATVGTPGQTWSLTIADIKKYTQNLGKAEVKIEVIYDAHLNENAYINFGNGETENKNEVYLQYSNNPNWDSTGELGQTPVDSVWVFTYDAKYVKYDRFESDENKMPNIEFSLKDSEGNDVELVAWQYTANKKTVVYEDIYYVKKSASLTTSTTKTVQIDGQKVVLTLSDVANDHLVSGPAGEFKVYGLDDGKYTLHEETQLEGYNTLADVELTIAGTHAENSSGSTGSVTLTKTNTDNKIINTKGALLPSTGGIGTTIFYLLGSIMFIGAAMTLVVRRRAEADEL